MAETSHTGGCLCGAVRYTARGEPRRVSLCHCETCRRDTGAPFGGFCAYGAEDVSFSGGTIASWRSSDVGERYFCPTCGSSLYMRYDGRAETILHLGSFDEPNAFAPSYELWTVRKPDWLPALDGVERFAHDRE